MMAPLARPNSASNWLLMTWNSDTVSIAILTWLPPPPPLVESSFAPPSTFSKLAARVWPLATIRSLPPLDGSNCRPGSSDIAANALRLTSGSAISSSSDTVPPTSAEVRSISGAAPETVIVSSMPPTERTTSRSMVRPTPSGKSVRS